MTFRQWLRQWTHGEPAETLTVNQALYMRRFHILPRNRLFSVYLHHFVAPDTSRDMHDHPGSSVSILLRGTLVEVTQDKSRMAHKDWGYLDKRTVVRPWWPVYRRAEHAHRLYTQDAGAWTLFIMGRRRRDWGYWTPTGWVHWEAYDEVGVMD